MEVIVKSSPKIEIKLATKVVKADGGDVKADGVYPDLTAGDLAGRGESVPASFGFRASGGKSIKDGRAYIKRIKGNSVVWNQQVKHESRTEGSCSSAWDGDVITIDGLSSQSYYSIMQSRIPCVLNEKFLIIAEEVANPNNLSFSVGLLNAVQGRATLGGGNTFSAVIGNSITTVESGFGIDKFGGAGTDLTGIRFKVRVINLTKMFQAGNEPTTIEEYEARKPIVEDEYAYNEGQVIHCNTESIKSVGDNAWDEQWEVGGFSVDGEPVSAANRIRSRNYIEVLANEEYYSNRYLTIFFYDDEMKFLSYMDMNSSTFTTPSGCRYIKFYLYGTEDYNHDILISLYHSGWKAEKDDQYQPYWQDILPLPIIRKYFPDGMKKAGTAHDEIRFNKASGKWEYSKGKIKSVDLWTLEWSTLMNNGRLYFKSIFNQLDAVEPEKLNQTKAYGICSAYEVVSYLKGIDVYGGVGDKVLLFNHGYFGDVDLEKDFLVIYDSSYTDVESFKAMLQEKQVKLYYESNDWEWVELDAEDQNFRDYYNVADFGTEQSQSNVPSAPFSADIIYQFNAVDMIREHELEITELQSIIATMQAQLASLINK